MSNSHIQAKYMETNEIVIMCQIATVVIMTISMVVAIISLVCSQKALSKELKEANKRMMTQLEHNQDLQTKQAQESFFADRRLGTPAIRLHGEGLQRDHQQGAWSQPRML